MSFSNNNGQQDQHLSLERGTVDYYQLIQSILSSGWRGIVAFETRDQTPSESIQTLNQIYDNLIHQKDRSIAMHRPIAS